MPSDKGGGERADWPTEEDQIEYWRGMLNIPNTLAGRMHEGGMLGFLPEGSDAWCLCEEVRMNEERGERGGALCR